MPVILGEQPIFTGNKTINGALWLNAAAAYADNGESLEVNKSADDGGIALFCWSTTDAERALIEFHKSASATIGTKALVANGEALGGIVWRAADSATGWSTAASIEGYIDAAPGDNDTGGRLVFSTTADGAASPTEVMRITSGKDVIIGGLVDTTWIGYKLQVMGNAGASVVFSNAQSAADAPVSYTFYRSRGTVASRAALNADDTIASLDFVGQTNDFKTVAQIRVYADTGWGATGNDAPGRMVLLTTPDGSATPAEAMRLDSTQMAQFLAGNVKIANATDGGTAGLHIRSKRAISAAMSGATVNIATQIPSGAMILGAQFNVDTAITGATSWSAAFNTGSTTSLGSLYGLTQNTKVNQLVVPEIASAATDITITAAGPNFSAGVIEAIVYYIDNSSMANA